MYCTITKHKARKDHKHRCEWCGIKVKKGDEWVKNVCMGEEFSSIEMHVECHDQFQKEFDGTGGYLAIEPYCNHRGEPAIEGTVYEV